LKDGKLKEWKEHDIESSRFGESKWNKVAHNRIELRTFLLTASRKGGWMGHEVRMADSRREYKVVVVTETARCRGEDNIKMDRKEMEKVRVRLT